MLLRLPPLHGYLTFFPKVNMKVFKGSKFENTENVAFVNNLSHYQGWEFPHRFSE